ncbi:uncharacterized protein LOC107637841 isoform X2 [Arachis ipaensis]|uniref:uncharacterized protein LOC107637841 isoform X2 n=1 Tax=Arachis ipaensis TaxID=130454 RepID=UPI0007AF01F3|nr:uncharacterized protein LOC107637841 isoform X2 [Arachis ipaensis]XP_025648468.1 uncharacterized protein LOC112743471 isoform X2 [Arachis hypogaea]
MTCEEERDAVSLIAICVWPSPLSHPPMALLHVSWKNSSSSFCRQRSQEPLRRRRGIKTARERDLVMLLKAAPSCRWLPGSRSIATPLPPSLPEFLVTGYSVIVAETTAKVVAALFSRSFFVMVENRLLRVTIEATTIAGRE